MSRSVRSSKSDPLKRYIDKRNFDVTSEPKGQRAPAKAGQALAFVIQKHWASRLHYDFRLELGGVLLSWAVPKGPSLDPKAKRMAIHVEDHPISYGSFEGTIPPKQYGAGKVIVWDQGSWEPVGDPRQGLAEGKLVFQLHGQKLAGLWELIRIAKPGQKQEAWLLFKKRDEWAQPQDEYDVIAALPDSVVERPLGPIEEREARASATAASSGADGAATELSAARKASLPATLAPQLATLASEVPLTGSWISEGKYDGYRLLARIDKGEVKLLTRNGHDWTHKLASLGKALKSLGLDSAWLDGEIVVMNEAGLPDFNALQNAMDAARSGEVIYFVFDAPYLGGYDLRAVPLVSRRAVLSRVFEGVDSERIRFSQSFDVEPAQLLGAACEMGLEGVMLKRADAPYVSDRTQTWLKLKCHRRQEFVVCGFTDRTTGPGEIGGLLLGYHDKAGQLCYAGKVGTGWDHAKGREIYQKLSRLERPSPPFDPATVKPGRWAKRSPGAAHWVKPTLVAEIEFTEWTPDGHVRHPSFKGWRTDKPARAITREEATTPANVPPRRTAGQRDTTKSIKITHPERVIDPTTGLKKIDLVHYYEGIAERILPHLKDRPVSLVRAPDGITGQLFFQKHPETKMPGLTELDPSLWPGHTALLAVNTPEALVFAAQMNVVEFHTWNSTTRNIDKPDRVIFDLDPGDGVRWGEVKEAAVLTRALLEELGLKAWLKTSGGKGLHVVVPLARRLDYDRVKSFSQAVVQHLASTIPSRFVAKSGPSNRVGKIFVDYLRNGHSQTTAAAFSTRARPGMGVSMPISWEALADVKSSGQWTIATAREYLSSETANPWADFFKCRQTLTKALKELPSAKGA